MRCFLVLLPDISFSFVIVESTHIRILAFSPAGIDTCHVQIHKEFEANCQQVADNLFVVPWDPERYREDLHHITVTVIDKDGRKNEVTQPFRFDEKQTVYYDTIAQFILHTQAINIFKGLFWFSIFLCVAPLIFFRIWHELIRGIMHPNDS